MDDKNNSINNSYKELENKCEMVAELIDTINKKEDYLKDVSHTLDFDVLSKQIKGMSDEKESERKRQRNLLIIFGSFLMLPIAAMIFLEWYYHLFTEENIVIWKKYIMLLPFVTLEAVFIYFFRIILQGYTITKHHLLQLNYRSVLTKFTIEYIKFVGEHNSNDKSDHLSKFEKLLYSEIKSDTKNIPTPLDGVKIVFPNFKG